MSKIQAMAEGRSETIAPWLWFDDQAEAAAKFYTGIFHNSLITAVTHYRETGQDIHGRPPRTVMTVAFELSGQPFITLNGGPQFKFNEAISFQVFCETQENIDETVGVLVGIPDAIVFAAAQSHPSSMDPVAIIEVPTTQPQEVQLVEPVEIKERFLEVRAV